METENILKYFKKKLFFFYDKKKFNKYIKFRAL